MLRDLDNPHRDLNVVHIGGTSGKGSTATLVADILRLAGHRVGLHVKPHLENVEERFVVDGCAIETEPLAKLIRDVAPIARRWRPSWYELTVALAFEHFRAQKIDVAVVEVGLGGTYDATNVVQPAVAVLTNVGLDHVEILGDSVELIAMDKVGIIKPGATTVSGATQESVRAIVRERAQAVGSRLWLVGESYFYNVAELGESGARFDLQLPSRHLSDLRLALLGAHQVANAATAVAACEALAGGDAAVSEATIREALRRAAVPGRLEVLGGDPLLVLDGAHNPAKMEALGSALIDVYPCRAVVGVLAFKRGHDLPSTLRAIAPRLRAAVLTTFDATTDFGRGQAIDPAEIDATLMSLGVEIPRVVERDPILAVQRAICWSKPSEVVCVTGSLYLIGVVRAHFGH
jgi:dihydrofolate synthase/folylpolyglutamate synthase